MIAAHSITNRQIGFILKVNKMLQFSPQTLKVSRKMAILRATASSHAEISKQNADTLSRRQFQAALAVALTLTAPMESQALGFKKDLKKRKISLEEYAVLPENESLRFYDLAVGSGNEVKPGTLVTVHFDCVYKGIDVVSSRSARLLGGNRSIAQPFQFVAGEIVSGAGIKKINDSANGLFAGQGGPKPPPALGTAVVGMKVGGRRSVLVPPQLGYGDRGEQEIGPNTPFELQVEVLATNGN